MERETGIIKDSISKKENSVFWYSSLCDTKYDDRTDIVISELVF